MADLDVNKIRDSMVAVAYEAGKMMLRADVFAADPDTKLNCALSYYITDKYLLY